MSNLEHARKMDAADPLAKFRARFNIPQHAGKDSIYFCGNSLGLQPQSAETEIAQVMGAWRTLGVRAHFEGEHPWSKYQDLLIPPLARIVGAKPVEVVAMNSLTANLHFMMVSFYRPTKARHKIVIEASAFPSDQYAVKSQILFHGFDPATSLVELKAGQDIEEVIDESVALVLIGGVNYYTGEVFDMERIVKVGRKHGCVVGFDLAHAVGNVPLKLHDWDADFAVWCSYKYLNAGPCGTAGCFVHERYANDATLPRFAGWWGHDKQARFKMGPDFVPVPGAEGWQLSNIALLAAAPLKASLDLFDEAGGMEALRQKSVALTGYLAELLKDKVEIFTPARRGCQLSLRAKGGRKVFDALVAAGVICDWREPDCIRVAPTPLYNTFEDCWRFADIFSAASA